MIQIKTLSKGKPMSFEESNSGVTLYTGAEQKSTVSFSLSEIEQILNYFQDKGWFPLSNDQTGKDLLPNGLGYFVLNNLHKLPKNASHIAAYLCHIKKLEYRLNGIAVELKIV